MSPLSLKMFEIIIIINKINYESKTDENVIFLQNQGKKPKDKCKNLCIFIELQ